MVNARNSNTQEGEPQLYRELKAGLKYNNNLSIQLGPRHLAPMPSQMSPLILPSMNHPQVPDLVQDPWSSVTACSGQPCPHLTPTSKSHKKHSYALAQTLLLPPHITAPMPHASVRPCTCCAEIWSGESIRFSLLQTLPNPQILDPISKAPA